MKQIKSSLAAVDGSSSLGVAKFVKATGRDKRIAQAHDAYRPLLDPRTGLVKESLVRYRRCPLCGSAAKRVAFVKNGFPHVKCAHCGMLYVDRVLKDRSVFIESSALADSWLKVLDSPQQRKVDAEKFRYGLRLLRPFNRSGSLLDIGCSLGHFLEIAVAAGWKHAAGVELHQQAVRLAREKGLTVYDRPLETLRLPGGQWDAVSMWEVLDDMENPSLIIREVHRLLRPGGGLLLLLPNAASLAVRVMQEHSLTFDGVYSLNFFSPKTLRVFLQRYGFEVQKMQTLIGELEVLCNYLNYDAPYLTALTENPLDFLTPAMVHKRLMGYKLLALASRRQADTGRRR